MCDCKAMEHLQLEFQVENFKLKIQVEVPPLENFVMNRVSGDYFENLLYKIFVSTDERSSVEKLAEVLDIDVDMVKVFST